MNKLNKFFSAEVFKTFSIVIIRMIFVVFSGLLLAVSFYDFRFALFAWFALVPYFFVLLSSKGYFGAWFYTFLFAIFFNGLLFSWVNVVTLWVGPVGWLGWLGIVLYLSIFLSAFGVVFYFFRRNTLQQMLCIPAAWVLMEWCQSLGVFGITISGLAYSQRADWVLSQSATIGGTVMVSYLIVIINLLLLGLITALFAYRAKVQQWFLALVCVFVFFSLVIAFNKYDVDTIRRMFSAEDEHASQVHIIQPNIEMRDKLTIKSFKKVKISVRESLTNSVSGAGYYLLPENVVPGLYNRNEKYYSALAKLLPIDSFLIFGSNRKESRNNKHMYYNSIISVNHRGLDRKQYDKVNLVPFGEYIPWRKQLQNYIPKAVTDYLQDINRGEHPGVFRFYRKDREENIGVSLCFESLFPSIFYQQHMEGAHAFAVFTDDGWFLNTIALKLHLNATAYRAVESRKQVFFSSNTGISAIISPTGEVSHSISYGHQGVISGPLKLALTTSLYYSAYNWLVYLSALIVLLGLIRNTLFKY